MNSATNDAAVKQPKDEYTAGAQEGSQPDTAQTAVWKGDFGHAYTDRNTFDAATLDQLTQRNYGITKTDINKIFLEGIAKDDSLLEVGCNAGNQLVLLRQMGYTNLAGVELQPYACDVARQRLPGVELKLGSVLDLPFPDNLFDVVFTSGVLIHIAPRDLPRAMDEIYRCAKSYIWGMEYYCPNVTEVSYRGHNELLWKMDYAQRYLERFTDLELVRERRLPYLENTNVDTVFLLRKK